MNARKCCTEIVRIIESVDNRCSAADGPVTATLQEMTQEEISRIYELACEGDNGTTPPAKRTVGKVRR